MQTTYLVGVEVWLPLLIIGCIVVTWLLFRRRRQVNSVTQPVCGKCGYAVQGLPTFTCPECGSDLREVGIVTVTAARRFGLVARWVGWTAVLLIVALLTSFVLVRTVLPYRIVRENTIEARPTSSVQWHLSVHARQSKMLWPWQTPEVSPPSSFDFAVLAMGQDPHAWCMSTGAVAERGAEELTRQFAAAGLSLAPEQAGALTDDVTLLTTRPLGLPPRGNVLVKYNTARGSEHETAGLSIKESSNLRTESVIWNWFLVVVWLAIWVLGLRRCVRAPAVTQKAPAPIGS